MDFLKRKAPFTLLLVLVFTNITAADDCLGKFTMSLDGFKLDTEKSVKDGAVFLSETNVTREEDCVNTCCKQQGCNAVVMEQEEEDLIKSCILFNCLYDGSNSCHFVRNNGYKSAISEDVTSLEPCMAPIKSGPCRGSLIRWHYNITFGKCEQFDFGGCKPNRNNYLSLEECNQACSSPERGSVSGRSFSLPDQEIDLKSGKSNDAVSERQAVFLAVAILVMVSVHGC